MKKTLIKIRNSVIGIIYRNLLKRILFLIDPEKVHDRALLIGKILGSNIVFRKIVSFFFNFSDGSLKQNISGIIFENPVGLAAGFDKDAEMIKIMPDVGFGFTEVGSVTGEFCSGNPKPRLWRMPKSKSIIVNYGLKNSGCQEISQRLEKDFSRNEINEIPLGINIAKTNSPETVDPENGLKDYLKGIKSFLNIGHYLTINISCPNASGGQSFSEPELLETLLKEVKELNMTKPIFLKMSPDLSFEKIDQIIDLSNQYGITGFICSNLTKKRDNPRIVPEELKNAPEGVGSISGKPAEDMSNKMISYIYRKTEGRKVIIGCGGIFNAQDAYKKIKLGASLLQLITGMIFEGPQIISDINLGLTQLLKKDGFKNINQAVGIENK